MFKKIMMTAALAVAVTGQALFAADMTKLIPEDTDFLLQINVSKILALPEVQKQLDEEFAKQPEQKKTYEELKTGLQKVGSQLAEPEVKMLMEVVSFGNSFENQN